MLQLDRATSPPILYPEDRPVDAVEGTWWVAHTKSRAEKAFAWDLIDNQIGCFLPLISRIHVRGGAKRQFLLPLFPSYVFFCGDGNDRADALRTGRVWQVISVADQTTLVKELSRLHIAIKSSGSVDCCPIPRGQLCRVTGGPMMGFEGVVIENRRATRLVLEISILGQGFSLEIDRDLLESVEPESFSRQARRLAPAHPTLSDASQF